MKNIKRRLKMKIIVIGARLGLISRRQLWRMIAKEIEIIWRKEMAAHPLGLPADTADTNADS